MYDVKVVETEKICGFTTSKGLTVLKAYPEDVETIVRLYSTETSEFGRAGKEKLRADWKRELTDEEKDYYNCSFIIRDNCKKEIGMVTFETKNKKDFEFFIWIPNGAKRQRWLNHILESLLEYAKEWTDIARINRILSLESFRHQIATLIGKDYDLTQLA